MFKPPQNNTPNTHVATLPMKYTKRRYDCPCMKEKEEVKDEADY